MASPSTPSTVSSPYSTTMMRPPRPGFVRGSVLGFLLGVVAAGAYGIMQLDERHKRVNGEVLAALEDLRVSARRAGEQARKVETTRRELGAMKESVVTRDELSALRKELRQAQEMAEVDRLELAAKVRDLEKDISLFSRSKQAASS